MKMTWTQKGIKRCEEDIKEMGMDYARKKIKIMEKCTNINQEFFNAYEWRFIVFKNKLDGEVLK